MDNTETVTIPRECFEQLKDIAAWFDALFEAGVRNWEEYDIAIGIYQQNKMKGKYLYE